MELFFSGWNFFSEKQIFFSIFKEVFTHRDRGDNRSTHYPGNWIVSVRVRTEHPVHPLLYLSISKQLVDSHDGLINCWLISKVPYQQLLDDKELIVDKVVLINKQPYNQSYALRVECVCSNSMQQHSWSLVVRS